MATIDLGKIKIVWKGTYSNGTAYVIDEAVVHSGTSYICIANTTGNTPPNGTYWNVLAQAGTDLATTLTTQGDMLYRDGSGLQRLAKGTANQELRINSGATAPEWFTPSAASSDFVKLGSVTANADSVATLNNLFTSDYKVYKIFIKRAHGSTDNSAIRVRYRNGSGAITSTDYKNFHHGGYFSSSSNTSVLNRSWDGDHHNLTLNGLDNNVLYSMTGEFTLFEPQSTDKWKNHTCDMVHDVFDQTLYWTYTAAGALEVATAITGIDFYMNTGNISGIFTLYGIKE